MREEPGEAPTMSRRDRDQARQQYQSKNAKRSTHRSLRVRPCLRFRRKRRPEYGIQIECGVPPVFEYYPSGKHQTEMSGRFET